MKNPTTKGPLKKSTTNPIAPIVTEASPRGKSVPMAPKINAGTGSQADGAKRVIQGEAKPAGRNSSSSTFSAPRKDGGTTPAECGYTKLGKA